MDCQVNIIGMGTFLGSKKLSLTDIADQHGKKPQYVRKLRIDNLYRFSDGESVEAAFRKASYKALRAADFPTINGVFASTGVFSSDCLMPGPGKVLADELELGGIPAYTISMGCAGGVHTLQMAYNQLVVDSMAGKKSNYLVAAGNQISRVLNPNNWSTAPLFSEGAITMVVSNYKKGIGIEKIATTTIPSTRGVQAKSILIENPRAGARKTGDLQMDGNAVYTFAVTMAYPEVLKLMGLDKLPEDIYFIPHQASGRIVDSMIQLKDLNPNQVYTKGREIGNTSGASVFFGLEDTIENNLHDGKKILLGAFGAELSISAALLRP